MVRQGHLIFFICLLLVVNSCGNQAAPLDLLTATTGLTTPTGQDLVFATNTPSVAVEPANPVPLGRVSTPLAQSSQSSPPAIRTTSPQGSIGVGSMQTTENMLTPRAAHAATLLLDGNVLLTGGFSRGDESYIASAELYDPAKNIFIAAGKLSIRRCCHTATRLPDGRVLIAGGFNGEYLPDAEIYDPATGEFSPTGSLNVARMDHVAVLLDNGKVLLVGGVGKGWTFLASAELYDPATGLFTLTDDMSVPRESHTITKLLDGRVLITGGHTGRHSTIVVYASAEVYDPVNGSFSQTGDLLIPRHKHDAVLLSDGRVLITGGSDERDDQGAYTSAEIYEPTDGSFSMAADMPGVRYKHIGTSLLLINGKALIAGGARNAIVYDPLSDKFTTVPGDLGTHSLSRLFSTATLLQDGSVLLAGGYGINQNVSAQAWVYQP